MASSLTHFSHPVHKLVKTKIPSGQFMCDLCRTPGSGFSYRCHACNFDLHEQCVELPETMSFFAHPWHNLHLQPGTESRFCDLCMEPVEGFYYRCIPCNFDVHPHCAKKQQIVYTELHPEHNLCLVPSVCICSACKKFDGRIWLYRCGMCDVSLHMQCLHGAIVSKEHDQSNKRSSSHGRFNSFMRKVGNEMAVKTAAELLFKAFTGNPN